jgi:hypothetical protein
VLDFILSYLRLCLSTCRASADVDCVIPAVFSNGIPRHRSDYFKLTSILQNPSARSHASYTKYADIESPELLTTNY